MRLSSISMNNLRRRKAKMLFLVLGLAIGVATAVTLLTVTATMRADIDKKLDEFGANILVVPKSDQLSLSYGGMAVSGVYEVKELRQRDAAQIMKIKNAENISTLAPKLVGAADVGKKRVLLVGVDFEKELRLKKWWTIKGAEPQGRNEVILGSEASRKLRGSAGRTINIGGRNFKISGVLEETGSQDDDLIFADLGAAQSILNKPGKLSLIELSALCNTCPIEEIVAQISDKLPNAKVSAVKQSVESKMNTVDQFTKFSLGITILVIFIGSLIVLITMMSSVAERTREIGIFRAIGFRRSHVMRVILLEALTLSIIGGVAGYVIGFAAAWFIVPQLGELSVPVVWNPYLAVLAIGLSVLISQLASLYPAIHASRLDPVKALRFI